MDLCKELYKLGKEKNLSPQVLFDILVDGFNFATIGFFPNCEDEAKEKFRNDCSTFVKAAGKFRKILANSIGQLISESLFDVLIFSKNQRKI